MAVVLDASVVLTWALREDRNGRGEELLEICAGSYVVVPGLFPTEVTNALLMAERRGRITAGHIGEFLRELRTLDIRTSATSLAAAEQILDLARSESLTGYDAAYLQLAESLGLPLATFDDALIRAAGRRGSPLA